MKQSVKGSPETVDYTTSGKPQSHLVLIIAHEGAYDVTPLRHVTTDYDRLQIERLQVAPHGNIHQISWLGTGTILSPVGFSLHGTVCTYVSQSCCNVAKSRSRLCSHLFTSSRSDHISKLHRPCPLLHLNMFRSNCTCNCVTSRTGIDRIVYG